MQPPEIVKITDPILGNEGEILSSDDEEKTGFFTKEFSPTKSKVVFQVTVTKEGVSKVQRDLYQEIEAWYSQGVDDIYQSILHGIKGDKEFAGIDSLDKVKGRFRLVRVDIRYPFSPPAKCILFYLFNQMGPPWCVRMGEDYHVEWSGLDD